MIYLPEKLSLFKVHSFGLQDIYFTRNKEVDSMKFKVWDRFKNLSLKSKRIIALCVCLLLLSVAVLQNVRTGSSHAVQGDGDSTVGNSDILQDLVGVSKIDDSEEYFAQKRLNRLNLQSSLTEEYQSVIGDTEASADAVTEAKDMLDTLNTVMQYENDLETQIKSMGYQDVFASFEGTGELDITVLTESLNDADVNTIAVCAAELTNVSVDQITIRGVAVIN